MDCNKEEATKATKLAEAKMRAGDYVGALELVTEAQKLFPDLEDIDQMIAVCAVHSCANKKSDGLGSKNWYGILGVQHFAGAHIIKKQYKKLSLLLHPDKNKYPGAESAFKLLVDANMVLSDKFKRQVFDVAYRSVVLKEPHERMTDEEFCALAADIVAEVKEYLKPFLKQESQKDQEPEPETKKRSFPEGDDVDINDHRRTRAKHDHDAEPQKYLNQTPYNHSYPTVQEVAILWKGKIRIDETPRSSSSSLYVLSFLHFIVAHKLHNSIIDRDETAKLASSIPHHKEAPNLFQSLGLDSMIPEFVQALINTSQYIPAVRLICFFKLEGFAPLQLLKKEVVNLITRSIQKPVSQEEDGEKLRDIFELAANYKLEIDIPGDLVVNLMVPRPSRWSDLGSHI